MFFDQRAVLRDANGFLVTKRHKFFDTNESLAMSPQGLHKRTIWADTRCPPKFIGNIQTHNFRNDRHGDLT